MAPSKLSHSFLFASAIICVSSFVGAFQTQPQRTATSPNQSSTSLHGMRESGRRNFINRGAGAAMSVLIGGTILGPPAEASYTAFTQREKDWEERTSKGDVKISSAASLRAQLREIAPMNSEGAKIFCPNGESPAVSPLMENRCGDRQALPSVYGRSDDAMGNSVPGFGGNTGAGAPTLRAELNAQAYFRDN